MANLIPKILRRASPSSTTVAAALHKPSPGSPASYPLAGAVFTQRLVPELTRPIPFFGIAAAEKLPPPPPGFIYPSFPFGLGLNPIPAAGFGFVESEDEVVDNIDDRTVRADSVKKKRKKKMNKHKYKKLRKRLRRKSRS